MPQLLSIQILDDSIFQNQFRFFFFIATIIASSSHACYAFGTTLKHCHVNELFLGPKILTTQTRHDKQPLLQQNMPKT
jgi:hypothetical protein